MPGRGRNRTPRPRLVPVAPVGRTDTNAAVSHTRVRFLRRDGARSARRSSPAVSHTRVRFLIGRPPSCPPPHRTGRKIARGTPCANSVFDPPRLLAQVQSSHPLFAGAALAWSFRSPHAKTHKSRGECSPRLLIENVNRDCSLISPFRQPRRRNRPRASGYPRPSQSG